MAKKIIAQKRVVWTQNDLDRQFPETAWLQRQERAISHLLQSGKITRNVAERRRRELAQLADEDRRKIRQEHLDARIEADRAQLGRERITGSKDFPPVNRVYLQRLIEKRNKKRR